MGACVSRRGDRAECRRCARLPAPSSASPFADAVADAALVHVPPAETKRRASFALGRSRGARVSPLTARALAQKALEEGDARNSASDEEDEDWRSARSAQTTRSWVTATGLGASETDDFCETFNSTSPDLRDFYADDAFSSSRSAPSLAQTQPGARMPPRASSGRVKDASRTYGASVSETETEAAFAALEQATADLEDDALLNSDVHNRSLEREEDDSNVTPSTRRSGYGTHSNDQNATASKPTGNNKGRGKGVRSRLAKIGEGARMVSVLRAAMKKAGGVLDLTAFKGTPIKWHAPHSALLAHARGESTLKRHKNVGEISKATRRRCGTRDKTFVGESDFENDFQSENLASYDVDGAVGAPDDWLARRPPRAARLFTSMFFSFGVRNDGRDHLPGPTLATEASPTVRSSEVRFSEVRSSLLAPAHGRMLAVVAAVLADCEPPALFKKPFNPVLGETARHELTFVDGSSIASVLEQVSHHPPVTAFHSKYRSPDSDADDTTDDTICGFAAFGHFRPRPSLRGFPFAGKVHIDIEGTRTFRVPVRGHDPRVNAAGSSREDYVFFEDYVSNYVGFEWLFFPKPRARTRAGETHIVKCARTGLVAEIEHAGARGLEVKGTMYEEYNDDDMDVDGNTHDETRRYGKDARYDVDRRIASSHQKKERKNTRRTPVFAIRGAVDAKVIATCLQTNETFVLYDADVAAVREAESIVRDLAFDFDVHTDPRGSFTVWRETISAMREKEWDASKRAKTRVEADERKKRAAGVRTFEQRFFERDETQDTWVLRADVAAHLGEPRRAPKLRGGGDAAR